MLSRDNNSSPTQYRTWVVDDQPDFDGYYYNGLKSGDEPFINTQAFIVTDDSAVVDFNLPNPISWNTTKLVLPKAIYNSQLAVLEDGYAAGDGYIYMFGGEDSYSILRATLDNPANWEDTFAYLPAPLSSSQLAVIDGYIYLFGGHNGNSTTDHIYSAPVNQPLFWTDHGSLLPSKLEQSQLVVADGYLYLLGGFDGYTAVDTIFKADATIPLVWANTGSTLPNPLFGSQVGIISGSIYLFGGFTEPGIPTSNIHSASLSTPTTWSVTGALPFPAFYGQFFIIATRGYLITPSDATESFTRIFRCNLSNANSWIDTRQTVPGLVGQSQFAVIGDRLFLFGGNGSSVIYADNSIVKFSFTDPAVISYGNVTRTLVDAALNPLDLFEILGFPPWKTDYGM